MGSRKVVRFLTFNFDKNIPPGDVVGRTGGGALNKASKNGTFLSFTKVISNLDNLSNLVNIEIYLAS